MSSEAVSRNSPAALYAIGQIAVNVRDLERAVAFYRDVLGVRFLFQVPKMAFFDCAGVRLMLGLPEGEEFDHPSSVLYFRVNDIQSVHAELQERGVAFRGAPHLVAKMPDHELWMAFFDDSEGNVMALMSEVR
jgi:predicted enzyme related to lactoylglutathione lyase